MGGTICCDVCPNEPYLLSIGNNVTVSSDALFCTHDNSISKVYKDLPDIFGKIKIGNNCFIGAGTTILCGVTLSDNIIVASGSIVTKSFKDSNIIIAGNPAKKISTWSDFQKKYNDVAISLKGLGKKEILLNLVAK